MTWPARYGDDVRRFLREVRRPEKLQPLNETITSTAKLLTFENAATIGNTRRRRR